MNYTKEECGCKVVSSFLCGNTIEYCPKHKAVDDLYEACVDLMDMQGINDGRVTERACPSSASILKAQKAICKAEGK